ncbi:MAG: FAD-binding protein [Actinobacteria bacterium]|nr:MAG: FAD-binding protein [Actinomycetota bacterium]
MSAATRRSLHDALAGLVGREAMRDPHEAHWGQDASVAHGVRGAPDAVVAPARAEQVAEIVAYCYERGLAVIPRGGGTGYAGGCVPIDGGVVLALERLEAVRSFEPERWRMWVEAGARTSQVRRRARENGLLFAPDPGAAEQSQIGGNIATNAGGPHAFKYGATGRWVTGLEVVLAPGELVQVGGPVRKDVAGYDLRSLLVGSEGTLGVITAAWLRLEPAPEAELPVLAFYADAEAGGQAILDVMAAGVPAAAVEFLDAGALAAGGASLPDGVPPGAGFLVVAEADGSVEEAARVRGELVEALSPGALAAVRAPADRAGARALWRWRDGVSLAVSAQRGGKLSEDIAVPVERLADAVTGTLEIGARHRLQACSWGHAGDGNVHATLLLDPADADQRRRAEAAAADLLGMAVSLGGTISGEHGLGWIKRGQLHRQWSQAAVGAHRSIKRALDPKGLLNPGKKEP